MKLKRLLPERYEKRGLGRKDEWDNPFVSFQRELNRMFDDFFEGVSMLPSRDSGTGFFVPRVNVSETDREITVSAELPGLDEKDVEVVLDRGVLSISGEKKDEKEEREKNYYYMERSSGSFRREIPIPEGYDEKNIKASFSKGVLRVVVPLLPEVRSERKSIAIKAE